ncbi:MAG: hypothetical protein ACOC8F_03395 [Planctomycetota bacterium]
MGTQNCGTPRSPTYASPARKWSMRNRYVRRPASHRSAGRSSALRAQNSTRRQALSVVNL